jgi:hypothetical protein
MTVLIAQGIRNAGVSRHQDRGRMGRRQDPVVPPISNICQSQQGCKLHHSSYDKADKQDGFERRLELYLMENFRHAFDMESYIYYTQAMQAECLAAAYRLWRREWRGRGRESTAGALVWQVSKWSIRS